jgi:bifunctional non-homologous end joining protein LigD
MSIVLRDMRSRLARAKASSLAFCRPVPATQPPSGPGWLHEIKQDGFRMMVRRDGERVRLITKNGYNWSARYPGIVAAAAALKCSSCVIDGEVMVGTINGLADFNVLRSGRQRKDDAAIYAFDLLMLNGEDLRHLAIEERKAKL